LRPGRKRLVVGSRDGVMPFLATVFLSMMMVYNFTGLVEWLPRYLYSG
jgi:TRAP-type mannitol/chloroaromatic compound transport system permease large subunit